MNGIKSKIKGFSIVRDSEGKPKFDNWFEIPEVLKSALTEADWEYIEQKRKMES